MAETTVSATEGWISRLPIADSVESARDLYQALYTLNRMELAPKNRFELMELYRQPVSQVTGQLQNRLSSSSYPLSQQRYRLAEFVRDLQVEMSYGYKIALFDAETHRRPILGKSSERAKLVFRSLHYLGNTIMRSVSSYLAYPKGIWKEIHALYQFAENHKCQHELVSAFAADSDRKSTIEKRYKEILLLALANPYKMPIGHSRQVNAFVYRWADLAEIKPAASAGNRVTGQFLVDFDEDNSGNSIARKAFSADLLRATARLLDCRPLVDHVESYIRQINTGTRARDLDLGGECVEEACKDMLQALSAAWKGNQKRRNNRIQIEGQATVCSGLSSIHHFVHQQQNLGQGRSSGQEYSTPLLLGVREPGNNKLQPGSFRVANWEVVNASSGGALIKGRDQTGVNVRIGDLLALMDTGKRSPIKLFAVRWMKELGAKGLEIGLEMLSDDISAILVSQERDGGSYVPALMLEKIDSEIGKLPRTLLLQRDLRGKQKDIELIEPGDRISKWVRVLDTIDHTASYERVTFVSLSRRDK